MKRSLTWIPCRVQVASSFQYRSRTEVASGGASSASVRRAPASAATRTRPTSATQDRFGGNVVGLACSRPLQLGEEPCPFVTGGDRPRNLNVANGALPVRVFPSVFASIRSFDETTTQQADLEAIRKRLAV